MEEQLKFPSSATAPSRSVTEAGTLVSILGPPGSGKSTVASALADRLGFTALHSGQLIREFVTKAEDCSERRTAAKALARGAPVPVHLYCAIISRVLADARPTGVLLDGYPRNSEQFSRMPEVMAAVGLPQARVFGFILDSPLTITRQRIHRRAVCGNCQAELHSNPQCCTQRLTHRRADDTLRMTLLTRRYPPRDASANQLI